MKTYISVRLVGDNTDTTVFCSHIVTIKPVGESKATLLLTNGQPFIVDCPMEEVITRMMES